MNQLRNWILLILFCVLLVPSSGRARYLNPDTGRFWSMDSFEGKSSDPATLHKYLYCQNNAINGLDPSGHETLVQINASTLISSSIQSGFANLTANAVVHAVLGQSYSGREMAWDFLTGGYVGASGSVTKFLAGNLGKTWVAKLAFQGGRHGVNALIGTTEAYLKNESGVNGKPPIDFNMEQFAMVFMVNYAASVAGDVAETWTGSIIKQQKATVVNAIIRQEIRSLTDLRTWLDNMAATPVNSVSAGERVFYGSMRAAVDKAIPKVQSQAASGEDIAETMLNAMQDSILETGAVAFDEWASP